MNRGRYCHIIRQVYELQRDTGVFEFVGEGIYFIGVVKTAPTLLGIVSMQSAILELPPTQ